MAARVIPLDSYAARRINNVGAPDAMLSAKFPPPWWKDANLHASTPGAACPMIVSLGFPG